MNISRFPLAAFACAFLLSSGFTTAAEEEYIPPVIDATETEKLLNARGDLVKVRGVVVRASSIESGMNFLNFTTGRDSGFVAVIFPQDVAAWEGSMPSDLYNGKMVELTGEIAIYQDNPQIVLRTPDQVRILEDADAPAEPASGTD